MTGRYLEEYHEGETFTSDEYVLDREELLAFARAYDPQPFHTDEKYAREEGPFGDVIASGFQTLAITFRLFVDLGFFEDGVGLGGPGMEEGNWLKPVFPGDRLTNHVSVVETRRSRLKPDRGILHLAHELRNQHGETVLTCRTMSMIKAREPGKR